MRIERVVEIEDPFADMGEIGGVWQVFPWAALCLFRMLKKIEKRTIDQKFGLGCGLARMIPPKPWNSG
jgi:hypothetical protein